MQWFNFPFSFRILHFFSMSANKEKSHGAKQGKISKEEQKRNERYEENILEERLQYNEMSYAFSTNIDGNTFGRVYRNNHAIANMLVMKSYNELVLRASSFRHARLFDECFADLQLSLNYGAPKAIVHNERIKCSLAEAECEQLKRSSFFKLSYKQNRKLPELADCLELRENKQFGRHIVTNRDLKAGDIVGLSEPFFKVFDRSALYFRCSHCFKENFMRLLGCKICKNGKKTRFKSFNLIMMK